MNTISVFSIPTHVASHSGLFKIKFKNICNILSEDPIHILYKVKDAIHSIYISKKKLGISLLFLLSHAQILIVSLIAVIDSHPHLLIFWGLWNKTVI